MSRVATITEAAEFEAPASAVWALLIDWPAIADWMPGGYIRSLECEGLGLGAVSHLVTGQGVHLSERLDAADEDSGILELSLVGELPWGLLSYAARVTLDELADTSGRMCEQASSFASRMLSIISPQSGPRDEPAGDVASASQPPPSAPQDVSPGNSPTV